YNFSNRDFPTWCYPTIGISLFVCWFYDFRKIACNRHSLVIAYYSTPIINFFLIVFSPLAYPLGKAIDFVLGEEFFTYYSREEFLELLNIQLNADGTYSTEEKEYLKYYGSISKYVITQYYFK